jgi:hypothetical protein
MAQILQSKGRRNEQGGTVYFADYVLTAGETTVSVQSGDTPGVLQSVEIADAEGGIKRAKVTTTQGAFSAASPGSSVTDNTIELVAGSRTEPIETFSSTDANYNFAGLSAEDLKEVKDAVSDVGNGNITPPSTGAKAKLYQYLIKGVTSYLAPSVTLRYIYTSSTVPRLANIMKTVRNPNNAPALPAGGNWLFANLTYQVIYDGTSTKYRVTEEFLASGRGGWDPNIYPSV